MFFQCLVDCCREVPLCRRGALFFGDLFRRSRPKGFLGRVKSEEGFKRGFTGGLREYLRAAAWFHRSYHLLGVKIILPDIDFLFDRLSGIVFFRNIGFE